MLICAIEILNIVIIIIIIIIIIMINCLSDSGHMSSERNPLLSYI